MSDTLFMTEVVQPILIKDGSLFLGTCGAGEIAAGSDAGVGLFHRDTRYLSRYALTLGGKPPLSLMASAARSVEAVHQLTNDEIEQSDGKPLEAQRVGVRLDRSVTDHDLSLSDRITVRNFATDRVRLKVATTVDALFEDIFELRGAEAKARGPLRSVETAGRTMAFRYVGADDVVRHLRVEWSRDAVVTTSGSARVLTFDLVLEPRATETIEMVFSVAEDGEPERAGAPTLRLFDGVRVTSDNAVLDRLIDRSFKDLALLSTPLEDVFIAGGLPWFAAPFGRDSLLAALQILAFDTRPGEGVARLFARHQGLLNDDETGEEPGKMPHEMRVGAMVNLKEVPHRPSYFSIDSTPLFLILIGRHAEWTRSLALFDELRPAIDAALDWMTERSRADPNGYLTYDRKNKDGVIHQGWKDSTSGVPRADGGRPEGPIALSEVQGYAWLARRLMADCLRKSGDLDRADLLSHEAEALSTNFNRDFWMEDEGCFCLGLEKGGRRLDVVSSNAGQVLWSGIADADKARRTTERLMRSDMNSGWGLRTLCADATAYNPLNYHLGSVWPFDNALIASGMKSHGQDDAAVALFDSLIDVSAHFAMGRLPEFYIGFGREDGLFPARCPFAEPLQAWSAGAAPYLLVSLLGLKAGLDGPELDRPRLPGGVTRMVIDGLNVGGRRYTCRVALDASGETTGSLGVMGSIG